MDLASEERNPNLWQEYIVHDDMKLAVEKICDSFKNEDKNQRRSFWIHGTYGTGKSYAAIVLKHLFTDSVGNIEDFFDRKRLLLPYKNKFLSIRRKGSGDFLVIWKSGCSDIVNGTHLMMEMEMSIRDALKEKFGDNAYYGRASLIEEVKRVISDNLYNWNAIFEDPAFGLKRDYADAEEFKEEVLSGSKDACNLVARICRDKGLALFSSVDNFKEWIADIISGNGLADKGIIFIWDEFTDFVKNSGDDNILQQLSEYCKKQPFFMFLIVHVDTSWVNGPKGIGFLYIRTGTQIVPLSDGGAQEFGLRAGTENVAAIVGMAVALKKNCSRIHEHAEYINALEEVLLSRLRQANIDFIRNGSAHHVPGNISLSFKNMNGEALLHRLDLMGICVSTGSACDSVNTQISHVLRAIKLDESYARGTIRISLSHENTIEEVVKIAHCLIKILKS